MSDLKLASAGDDLKIWDVNGYSLVKQYNPHSSSVSCVAWSHDNNILCSASSAGDKVVLNYTGANNFTREITHQSGRSCIAFNSSSRYVVGGGTDGNIHVWDLKSNPHTLKKSYKDHKGPVTTVQFNWNDTVIASGSETGEIILFNVVTGLGMTSMSNPKTQAIRQLQYSHFTKSLLVSASDDGSVNMWDTATKRLIHGFEAQHGAPATSLAFSPLNAMLLISAGLDKRIVCYDAQNKTPIRTMVAESPLTSADLYCDGSTLAVGSIRGKIYIYDLRSGDAPIDIITAHKSSVQSLKYQYGSTKKVSGKAKVSISNRISHDNTSGQVKRENGLSNLTSSLSFVDSDRLRKSEEGVFSPVRDKKTPRKSRSTRSMSGERERRRAEVSRSLDASGPSSHLSSDNLGGGALFSPAQDEASRPDSSLEPYGASSSAPWQDSLEDRRGFDDLPSHVDALDLNRQEAASAGSLLQNHSLQSPMNSLRGEDDVKAVSRISRTPQDLNVCDTSARKGFVPDEAPQTLSSRIQQFSDSAHYPLPTPPDAMPSAAEGGATATEQLQPQRSVFQAEFIRNLIEDSLEDFREDVRRDVMNLHLEVIKQFQLQQMEMANMLQHYSRNDALEEEVVRLREENKRLQKKF